MSRRSWAPSPGHPCFKHACDGCAICRGGTCCCATSHSIPVSAPIVARSAQFLRPLIAQDAADATCLRDLIALDVLECREPDPGSHIGHRPPKRSRRVVSIEEPVAGAGGYVDVVYFHEDVVVPGLQTDRSQSDVTSTATLAIASGEIEPLEILLRSTKPQNCQHDRRDR